MDNSPSLTSLEDIQIIIYLLIISSYLLSIIYYWMKLLDLFHFLK
jgi:hypothetical protein